MLNWYNFIILIGELYYFMEHTSELSPAKLMWQMTRPHTLTATFSPVILGTVIAMYETNIDWLLFIAMMLACLALQIATNLFNEYYDFKRGLDTRSEEHTSELQSRGHLVCR